MATCTICGGLGGREGNYPACYRCGGSGAGGFTNIACGSCGGSGRGSTREWMMCAGCGGSGAVSDPHGGPGFEVRGGGRGGGARRPMPPWTRANTIAALAAFFTTGVWLLVERLDLIFVLILSLIAAVFIGRWWRELALFVAIFAGGILVFQIVT